ncbi:MAG: PAS domain S-box protein [Candidatus Polarisedimenticolaceae bacterium]|nr:PAS domain S-box protein [Candidatus Polarisedimenticolaceae bacterium]
MKIQTSTTAFFAVFFAALLLLATVMVEIWRTQQSIIAAEHEHYTSFKLANQLRQSSDDLTRMVRTYTVTGHQKYRDYFNTILAIRDGKAPRPANYETLFWDFIIPGLHEYTPIGTPVSLNHLMRQMHLTPEELAKLEEAHDQSDKLVNLERQAIAAMSGLNIDSEESGLIAVKPNILLAQQLTHDLSYHQAKAAIMKPISDFFSMIEARTERALEEQRARQRWLTLIAGSIILITLLISIISCIFIERWLIDPLGIMARHAKEIAKGHYKNQLEITAFEEIGSLATSFNKMTRSISSVMYALQESETKYRSIFESSMVGMIVVIDEDGFITEWNAGAHKAFGYSASEAIGQPITRLMPERIKKLYSHSFSIAQAHKELSNSDSTHLLTGLRKGGEEFPLELTLGCWERADRLYFSAIMFDVTEQRQVEKTLRRTQKMDAIGQLTGGIAHDFNNILGIILGNLELLKPLIIGNKDILKRVETINTSAQRAADLTKQLLSFSRSQPELISSTDINEEIGKMGSLIRHSVTPTIEIKHDLADDLWLANIDAGDFHDTLLNLVINARDAMPEGGQLTLKTYNCTLNADYCERNPNTLPGQYVALSVSDSGEGIHTEQLEHIFEPFFTTKEPGKGTGLGLSMVFGFIQRSKGQIKVYSELGVGTTFKLYLPQLHPDKQLIIPVDKVLGFN